MRSVSVCAGVDAYRDALEKRAFRAVAMSVLASGAIPTPEAIEWVWSLPNMTSIVFGASSAAHIQSTKALVNQFAP
jgi:aryl-alcohol dehydrogenase-like predicted oxidoreductase